MSILRFIFTSISELFKENNKNDWYEKGRTFRKLQNDKKFWNEKGHELKVKKQKKKKIWLKIKKGDSQVTIASIIGKPDSIQKEEDGSGREIWVYDCGTEGMRAITFKDGFIEKIEVKY